MIGLTSLVSAAGIGGGIYTLLVSSDEEKLYRDFATSFGTTSAEGLPYLVGRTEARLFDLAAKARRSRLIGASVTAGMALLYVGGRSLRDRPDAQVLRRCPVERRHGR